MKKDKYFYEESVDSGIKYMGPPPSSPIRETLLGMNKLLDLLNKSILPAPFIIESRLLNWERLGLPIDRDNLLLDMKSGLY